MPPWLYFAETCAFYSLQGRRLVAWPSRSILYGIMVVRELFEAQEKIVRCFAWEIEKFGHTFDHVSAAELPTNVEQK